MQNSCDNSVIYLNARPLLSSHANYHSIQWQHWRTTFYLDFTLSDVLIRKLWGMRLILRLILRVVANCATRTGYATFDICTMPSPTDTVSKNKAFALLHAHWKPDKVAEKIFRHRSTLFRWENRIQMYGAIDRPQHLHLPQGRQRRIHTAAVKSLLEYQKQNP